MLSRPPRGNDVRGLQASRFLCVYIQLRQGLMGKEQMVVRIQRRDLPVGIVRPAHASLAVSVHCIGSYDRKFSAPFSPDIEDSESGPSAHVSKAMAEPGLCADCPVLMTRPSFLPFHIVRRADITNASKHPAVRAPAVTAR